MLPTTFVTTVPSHYQDISEHSTNVVHTPVRVEHDPRHKLGLSALVRRPSCNRHGCTKQSLRPSAELVIMYGALGAKQGEASLNRAANQRTRGVMR